MKLESLGLDTACPEAQEAKRLGVAVHGAIELAVRDKRIKANIQAMHAAQKKKSEHGEATGWSYRKSSSTFTRPHWTYHPEDDVEVRIYDQEDQS